ncbi:hypothetical protein GE21DRAFT_1081119 [Neurospora crassa]|nr:hypothetical protein GE21DRAFT_1081119 [Neurospora crassa]
MMDVYCSQSCRQRPPITAASLELCSRCSRRRSRWLGQLIGRRASGEQSTTLHISANENRRQASKHRTVTIDDTSPRTLYTCFRLVANHKPAFLLHTTFHAIPSDQPHPSAHAALQSPLRAIVILTSSCWAKSHIWGLVAALASKTNDSLLPTENYMLG